MRILLPWFWRVYYFTSPGLDFAGYCFLISIPGVGKINNIYDEVVRLLTADAKYRDSDSKLVARIWNDELCREELSPDQLSSYKFLCLYATDKLTSAESITRARRRAQENYAALRGESYKERHIYTEEVKQELRRL